jgi:hypothetical protein
MRWETIPYSILPNEYIFIVLPYFFSILQISYPDCHLSSLSRIVHCEIKPLPKFLIRFRDPIVTITAHPDGVSIVSPKDSSQVSAIEVACKNNSIARDINLVRQIVKGTKLNWNRISSGRISSWRNSLIYMLGCSKVAWILFIVKFLQLILQRTVCLTLYFDFPWVLSAKQIFHELCFGSKQDPCKWDR